LRPRHEYRDGLEAQARVLARGTYMLAFLREEGRLAQNPHLVLGLADALLRSLRGLRLNAGHS
jgi:hypothetical protein